MFAYNVEYACVRTAFKGFSSKLSKMSKRLMYKFDVMKFVRNLR